jgi:hypothetical protein
MAARACVGWILLYHLRHVYMDMLNMQSFYLIRIILSRFTELEISFLSSDIFTTDGTMFSNRWDFFDVFLNVQRRMSCVGLTQREPVA